MAHLKEYIGDELALFSQATNWKNYYKIFLRNYLGKQILEVGAGLGYTTLILCDGTPSEWICLEPDLTLGRQLHDLIIRKKIPPCCIYYAGTIDDLSDDKQFDTIIYIDVLEHIPADNDEIQNAVRYLKDNGNLIILSPAHPFLFSSFDRAIGHRRRYTKKKLKSIIPPNLEIEKIIYLDSVGMFLSLVNKYILKQKYPTLTQILFWDKVVIKISRVIDRLLFYRVGKSILLVAHKLK